MTRFQPSLSSAAEIDTARCVPSGDQDRCEMGYGSPLDRPGASIGEVTWLPPLSVRTTSLYCEVRSAVCGMQPAVSDGSRATASLAPSGLTAGSEPLPIRVGLPPVTGTDSTSVVQPWAAAKYTVVRSAETEISSPMTPLGTSVLAIEPLAESSMTSAPPLVTATTAGGPVAAAGLADAAAVAVPGLAAAVVCDPLPPGGPPPPLLPPPHAASSSTAAGSAMAISRFRRQFRSRCPGSSA